MRSVFRLFRSLIDTKLLNSTVAASAIISVALCSTASAQPQLQQVRADGEHYRLTVTNASAPSKRVIFWYLSDGNLSTILNVFFGGPAGASVSLRSRVVKDATAAAAVLSDQKGWNSLKLTNPAGRDRASYTFPASSTSAASPPVKSALIDCSTVSEEIIQNVITYYKSGFGVTLTREDLCGGTAPANGGGTGGNGGGGSGGGGSGDSSPVFRSLLSKDTCQSAKGAKYLVAIEYDLTAVAQSELDAGVELLASVEEYVHRGNRAASIKPVSDGKFAPRPLVLMSSVGTYFTKEQISLVRWNKNRIKSRKHLRFAKSLYYKGLYLSSALVDNVLTGGKGTFEITNGVDIYSVCFRLQRTRQRVNGYPS